MSKAGRQEETGDVENHEENLDTNADIENNENIDNNDNGGEQDQLEERAFKMGWVPKEDFKGNPDMWRPAADFVERGETMIPFLNRRIRGLEKQQIEKDKAFDKYLGDMREKLHSQKVDEHEARKRQAVEEGDTDAYNRLSSDAPKNDLPVYEPPKSTVDPAFDEWVAENPWYQSDFEKNQEAENYGRFLRSTKPDLEGRDFLDEVSKHVRRKYENPNRNRSSAVGGGTQKASGTAGKLFNSLEADAKAVFNSFVRDGIFKNTAEDREAYAKDVLG